MSNTTKVYRPTLTIDEVEAIINHLVSIKQDSKLLPHADLALSKLQLLAFKDRIGVIKPAYQQTGAPTRNTLPISLEALGGDVADKIVSTKEYLGIDRRTQDGPILTAEQIEEAKFAAADHFVATGEKIDWKEFIQPNTQPTIEEKREENLNVNANISDEALFKAL